MKIIKRNIHILPILFGGLFAIINVVYGSVANAVDMRSYVLGSMLVFVPLGTASLIWGFIKKGG